jgi:hypothetical protein
VRRGSLTEPERRALVSGSASEVRTGLTLDAVQSSLDELTGRLSWIGGAT